MIDPLATPGRIAFAGDWHENGPWAAKAIGHAKSQGADVVIQLGDFGYSYSRQFLDTVSGAASDTGIPVLFVDGNHEAFPRLHAFPFDGSGLRVIGPNVLHLPRGFRWPWGGLRFLALGGAHSVDRPFRRPQVSWWPEETITEGQAANAVQGGLADVLISHDCPAGVVIPGIDDRSTPPPFPPAEIELAEKHRQVLRGVVDAVRPRAIWHGHYHVPYTATADFGYGPVAVRGLDCDETTLDRNVTVVDLGEVTGDA
jgi:hypothetical protein